MNQTTIVSGEDDKAAAAVDGLTSVRFSPDLEARAGRAVMGLLFVFVGVAGVGLVALWLGEAGAKFAGGALVASAVVYLVLAIVACLMPRPLDSDGLSMDPHGLTVTRAGADRRWSWRDLGKFSIAHRAGLAGRLLGRQISIHIPALVPDLQSSTTTSDPALREATILRIAGDYLASDDEIAHALLAFRDHAAGPSAPDALRQRRSSRTYHPRDQAARTVKTRTVAISGVVSWVCVYAAASAVGGLYDGWQAFIDHWTDPLSHPIILTVAMLFVPYDIWSGLRKSAPAGNQLRIDADGLVLAVEGRRRRWRWDAVSAPEIQEVSGPDGETGRCIAFIARHDGLSSGPQATPGLLPAALRIDIDDIYDSPLESMLGEMAGFRAGFQFESVATGAAAPGAVPLPN